MFIYQLKVYIILIVGKFLCISFEIYLKPLLQEQALKLYQRDRSRPSTTLPMMNLNRCRGQFVVACSVTANVLRDLASLRHLGTRFHRKMVGTRTFLRFLNVAWLKHTLAGSTTGTIWNSLYQQTNEQLAPIGSRFLCLGLSLCYGSAAGIASVSFLLSLSLSFCLFLSYTPFP